MGVGCVVDIVVCGDGLALLFLSVTDVVHVDISLCLSCLNFANDAVNVAVAAVRCFMVCPGRGRVASCGVFGD